MFPEEDTNCSGERPPSTQRTDAKQTNTNEDEMAAVLLDLIALGKITTEAQREAAALRQRLKDGKESDNAGNSRGNDSPAPETVSVFDRAVAQTDRALIVRGLSYLDNALKVERLLHHKT